MSAFQIIINYKTYPLNFAFIKDICPNIGLVWVWIRVDLVGWGSKNIVYCLNHIASEADLDWLILHLDLASGLGVGISSSANILVFKQLLELLSCDQFLFQMSRCLSPL